MCKKPQLRLMRKDHWLQHLGDEVAASGEHCLPRAHRYLLKEICFVPPAESCYEVRADEASNSGFSRKTTSSGFFMRSLPVNNFYSLNNYTSSY